MRGARMYGALIFFFWRKSGRSHKIWTLLTKMTLILKAPSQC